MKVLGLIPARGGSKGVPNKNIKLLAGKPLLQYTIDVAKKSKLLSYLLVSSDSSDIINLAKSLSVHVPFKRPAHLAEDTTPTLPVIVHALEYLQKQGIEFDAVCLLQPTSPLRTAEFIDNAIRKLIETGADALVSVKKVPHEYNPHWVFKEKETGCLELFTGEKKMISRRQDLPITYHRDGSLYITKTGVILNQKSLYGEKLAYIESPYDVNINIDTKADWLQAEKYFNSL